MPPFVVIEEEEQKNGWKVSKLEGAILSRIKRGWDGGGGDRSLKAEGERKRNENKKEFSTLLRETRLPPLLSRESRKKATLTLPSCSTNSCCAFSSPLPVFPRKKGSTVLQTRLGHNNRCTFDPACVTVQRTRVPFSGPFLLMTYISKEKKKSYVHLCSTVQYVVHVYLNKRWLTKDFFIRMAYLAI